MRIKMIKKNKTMDVNPSYGLRLIEQGKAIRVPTSKGKAVEKESAEG